MVFNFTRKRKTRAHVSKMAVTIHSPPVLSGEVTSWVLLVSFQACAYRLSDTLDIPQVTRYLEPRTRTRGACCADGPDASDPTVSVLRVAVRLPDAGSIRAGRQYHEAHNALHSGHRRVCARLPSRLGSVRRAGA